MVDRVTYIPPSQADWTRLATSPPVAAAVRAVAVQGKAIAESIAASFADTGRYGTSFDVRTGTTRFAGHVRASADLVNTAGHAAQVELRHHVLARTRDGMAVS
jgi:hypothetical protein